MILFILNCFPEVNDIFALPLMKTSLFKVFSCLQAMNSCLKVLAKHGGLEVRQCCIVVLQEETGPCR